MIHIRLEAPGDAASIHATNEAAFDTPLEATIVDALRGTPDSISLVATSDAVVVGHILFTPATVEPPVRIRLAALAPMAVRPDHQRQGIGGRLIEAGLAECRRFGYSAVVLVGHPEYYPRFGFEPAHRKGLACGFEVAPEAFMAIELEPNALAGVHGIVRFRPEFEGA